MDDDNNFVMTIGGKSVATEQTFPVINPATEDLVAKAPKASLEHLDAAVSAARNAFPLWSSLKITERQDCLLAIGKCLDENRDYLIDLLIQEQGKSKANASGEIDACIYWCSALSKQDVPVEIIEDTDERRVEVHHQPLGVVAAITAWNFPLMLMIFKILPALLAGNTVIVKPSPFTPLTSLKLGELLQPIFPEGVINVISGADDLGPAITAHPAIDKISFTGSTATGKKIMESSGATLKRLTLELGGNDAAIILPDVDVKKIVEPVFWGAFQNSGQVCVAAKRIYVHADIYDLFLQQFVEYAKTVVVGSAADQSTQLGPVQNQMQFDRVSELINDSKKQGHKFALGGDIKKQQGYFIPVTIVDNPPDSARVVPEEAFGPVVPLLKFTSIDEVIERANNSPYGLGGSIWTKDFGLARKIAGRLETGTVWVNEIQTMSPDRVFSGRKNSGFGAEQGLAGLLEFTSPLAIAVNKAL